jgi:hypothetical protein
MSETLTEKTLEVLELETGSMGCISPDRHQQRWLQKVQHLENQIAAANSPSEKLDLEAKLTKLNQIEAKKSALIVDIHNLNSDREVWNSPFDVGGY